MVHVIRCVGFANGLPCPFAGDFVESFDHDAHDGRGFGEFTPYLGRAMKFDSFDQAIEFWRKESTVKPLRPDGKPNRPLSSMSVIIERL